VLKGGACHRRTRWAAHGVKLNEKRLILPGRGLLRLTQRGEPSRAGRRGRSQRSFRRNHSRRKQDTRRENGEQRFEFGEHGFCHQPANKKEESRGSPPHLGNGCPTRTRT